MKFSDELLQMIQIMKAQTTVMQTFSKELMIHRRMMEQIIKNTKVIKKP